MRLCPTGPVIPPPPPEQDVGISYSKFTFSHLPNQMCQEHPDKIAQFARIIGDVKLVSLLALSW
jgi:hypothetical protein